MGLVRVPDIGEHSNLLGYTSNLSKGILTPSIVTNLLCKLQLTDISFKLTKTYRNLIYLQNGGKF